jgi:hypothetical protein
MDFRHPLSEADVLRSQKSGRQRSPCLGETDSPYFHQMLCRDGKEATEMRRIALRHLTKLALMGALIFPFALSSEAHEKNGGRGRVVIVPHYSYYYPYRAWGWGVGWGWGNPYGYYQPYYPEATGKIKLKDYIKSDQVYIDGAYAGTAAKMKTVKLDPGRYTIEIRRQGTEILKRSVYVVAGKTVEIDLNGS